MFLAADNIFYRIILLKIFFLINIKSENMIIFYIIIFTSSFSYFQQLRMVRLILQ